MNLVLKSINREKNKIREFHVSIFKDPTFSIIYEYLSEYETFLPGLIEGIKSFTTEDMPIYCVGSSLYSELNDIKKLKVTEDKIELLEQKEIIA